LKSNRSDDGAPAADAESSALPRELADAIARVAPRLGSLAAGLRFFETIGSTNDVALDWAAAQPPDRADGLVVIAEEQTAGRGRRGRAWFSPPGSGLYVSIVLAPARAHAADGNRARRAMSLLTLAVGVGLAEGVAAATGLQTSLKWPNDVYVSGRKLAGILAEAAAPSVVVGFGLNVGAAAFPPELADRATSLETELGRSVDRFVVLAEALASIAARCADLDAGRFDAILDAWRRRAYRAVGARVACGSIAGVTVGIDDDGALLVKTGERIERIVSGEVTWLP